MANQITRWYKQIGSTEISYDEAEGIALSVPDVINENINIKNGLGEIIFQTFDETIRKETNVYHITTQFSIKQVLDILGKEKFSSNDFNEELIATIKSEALSIFAQSFKTDKTFNFVLGFAEDSEDEVASEEVSERLPQQMLITQNFYVDPGNKDAGSLIYFQVLLFVDGILSATIDLIENPINNLGIEEETEGLDSPIVDKDEKRSVVGIGDGEDRLNKPNKLLRKIYNDGSTAYKTTEQVDQELLRLGITDKRIINDDVRKTLLQVGDPVVLNILRNATEIKTIDDVYKKVLDSIPVEYLIRQAAKCTVKLIKSSPLSQVCNTIMRNLTNRDVQNIILYLYSSVNPEAAILASLIKAETSLQDSDLDQPTPSSTTIAIVRDFLIQTYRQGNPQERDIICVVVLAALPAALGFLSTVSGQRQVADSIEGAIDGIKNMSKEALEDIQDANIKAAELIRRQADSLVNPAREAMENIADTLEQYQGMRMGSDSSQTLKEAIYSLVTQIVVETIGALLRELAGLCDGTSAADFSNLKSPDGAAQESEELDDLGDLQFPYEQDNLQEIVTNPEIFDEIEAYLENKVSRDVLDDFFDSLNDLLTVSEMCSLFSKFTPLLNYNSIINKIYYGLLSLERFKSLRDALRDQRGVKELFLLFSGSIDSKLCKEKIDALQNTKKVLNALCSPVSDDFLAEDLRQKLTEDALKALNNSENQILEKVMDSIYQLQNPSLFNTPVFCGPDADGSDNPPIFKTLQHDTSQYIDEKFLNDSFLSIQEIFERELFGFKMIFTNQFGTGPESLAKFFQGPLAPANLTNAMNSLYKFADPSNSSIQGLQDINKAALNGLVNQFNTVAKKVYNNIVAASKNGIITETTLLTQYIKIYLSSILSDQPEGSPIQYRLNYGNFETDNIPPNTAALVVGSTSFFSSLESHSYQDFFDSINNLNGTEDQSEYSNNILSTVKSISFFGALIEQMIKEHAEYVSSGNDLFKKENFDKIQVNKKNSCDKSLFSYEDIVTRFKENSDKLGCILGLNAVPTAVEKAKIYSFYEAYVRVLTINEFLKSFFTFASYGIDAIIPPGSEDKKDFDSFYFTYLVDQVRRKVLIFEQNDIFFFESVLQESIRQVYVARNNLDLDNPGLTDEQMKSNSLREIISTSIKQIQPVVVQKIVNSGFVTKGTFFEEGEFAQEFTDPLQNVYQTCLNNILATSQNYNPPPVIEVDFDNHITKIPNGFYSKNAEGKPSRLFNGGFFLENGFEVQHKRFGESGVFEKSLYDTIFLALPETAPMIDKTKTVLTPSEVQQSGIYLRGNFNQDVFGGSIISKYLFGSVSSTGNKVPSYDIQDVYFDNQAFQYLTSDQVKELSKINGYISYDSTEYQAYRDTLASPENVFNSVSDFISLVVNNLQFSPLPVHAINAIEQQLKDQSKYFSSLSGYKTLNILIPVEELSDTNYLSLFADLANSFSLILNAEDSSDLNNQIDKLSRKDFVNAALQRKYFVQEGTDGKKYFKLPLVKIQTCTVKPTAFKGDSQFSFFPEVCGEGAGFEASFANSDTFRALVDSMQYKNILSFVAVLLTESVQKNYPNMDNLFRNTLQTLNSSKNNVAATADRENNQDFYKYTPEAQLPADSFDFNLINLFLETLLKGAANMVDPTWKTPWLLPGPLTPIGIVAKILDGIPDDSDQSTLSDGTQEANNIIQGSENTLDCED